MNGRQMRSMCSYTLMLTRPVGGSGLSPGLSVEAAKQPSLESEGIKERKTFRFSFLDHSTSSQATMPHPMTHTLATSNHRNTSSTTRTQASAQFARATSACSPCRSSSSIGVSRVGWWAGAVMIDPRIRPPCWRLTLGTVSPLSRGNGFGILDVERSNCRGYPCPMCGRFIS